MTIVDKVIARVNLTSDGDHVELADILDNIDKALGVLSPFVPDTQSKIALSEYLLEHKADAQTCLQAWALFMDYKTLESIAA